VSSARSGPRLILLHGLGATQGVWAPMLKTAAERWPGPVEAPDLRGHGHAPHADSYTLDAFAGDIAELVRERGDADGYAVLGHSMGGVVALALASGRFASPPLGALGLGVKVAWSDEERAGLAKRAATPAKVFATREEAVERYLKSAGLSGLVATDSDMALEGVAETEGGWRLACDPRTAEVGPPPMATLTADARAPIALACGEHDPMVNVDQLRAWDPKAEMLPGLGHNAMDEKPVDVWNWALTRLPVAR
jgi:pimeloyl-ACP methyl ester carboxylesterase